MNRVSIARVAHAVNMAYCLANGDTSHKPWDEAPEAQRASILAGVDMHLANPGTTPEQAHEAWLAAKKADGWAYGEVKNDAEKLHPCFLPYDELPAAQKAKDHIFRAVVHAVHALGLDVVAAPGVIEPDLSIKGKFKPESAAPLAVNGLVSVTYIGRRETYTDRIYGTKLTFEQGQTRAVPEAVAKGFLKHVDLFKLADAVEAKPVAKVATKVEPDQVKQDEEKPDDTGAILEQAAKEKAEANEKQNELQDLHDQVAQMDKSSLEHFALTKYRQQIDKRLSVPKLREQVVGFINQYGVV